MFVVRKLFGSSNEAATSASQELINLPTGRFYLVRPTAKVQRECIYLEADITIRRTSAQFYYQLVVGREINDEEDLAEDDNDLEKAFLLDEALQFSVYPTVDEGDEEGAQMIAFSWVDVSSPDGNDRFEFVINPQHKGCSIEQVSSFEDVAYRCMWECMNKEDSTNVTEDDLLPFKTAPLEDASTAQASPQRQGLFRPPTPDSDVAQTEQELETDSEFEPEPAQEDPDDSQSDSSGAEIANQLKAVSLNRKSEGSQLYPALPDAVTTSPSQVQDAQRIRTPVEEDDPHPQSVGSRLTSSSRQPSEASSNHPQNVLPAGTRMKEEPHSKPEGTQLSSLSRRVAAGSSHQVQDAQQIQTPTKKAQYPDRHPAQSSSLTPQSSHVASPYSQSAASPHSVASKQKAKAEDPPVAQRHEPLMTDADNQPHQESRQLCWSEHCDVFLFDTQTGGFQLQQANVEASLWTPTPGSKNNDLCWLSVVGISPETGEPMNYVCTNLGNDQSLSFREGVMTFNYVYRVSDTDEIGAQTWALKFPGDEQSRDRYTAAQEAFAKALFDRENGPGSYEAADQGRKEWSRLQHGVVVEDEDVEMADGDLEAEEEFTEESEGDDDAYSDEDEGEESAKFRGKQQTGPKNSQLAVGCKDDLSFVLRGNMIGVFQNELSGNKKLKFMVSIAGLTTPDGKRDLEPSKIMLHGQDSTMVLQDPLNPESLYSLDIGTGKVVDEWKIGGEAGMTNFFPRAKFSQMNPESTFLGTSHNTLFTIDPRLSGSKVVKNESKEYKGKMNFTCAATTEAGHLVLGSSSGEIRLYSSQLGKAAKALLPSMRDPILGLDVTKDGKYVVATCPTYLLLIDTELKGEGRYKGMLGFERSFPAAEKPVGRRIELTPQHKAFIIEQDIPFCFNPAKFNRGPDSIEKTVVTTMGPYIIAFNLRKLKIGQTEYTLKKYEEDVVADGFRWGNDRDIVVTMASDVFMENRAKLSKPDRQSLIGVGGGSRRMSGRAGSGIVQEWNG